MKSPISNPVKLRFFSSYHIAILFVATLLTFGCAKQTPQITNPDPSNPPPLPPPVQTVEPGDSAAMIYIAAGNTNDLYALDGSTGKVVWSKKVTGPYTTSA